MLKPEDYVNPKKRMSRGLCMICGQDTYLIIDKRIGENYDYCVISYSRRVCRLCKRVALELWPIGRRKLVYIDGFHEKLFYDAEKVQQIKERSIALLVLMKLSDSD